MSATTRPSIAEGVAAGMLRLRTDGDHEVADHGDADDRYGCARDCECILADGHGGDCDLGSREEWAGTDTLYPTIAERLDAARIACNAHGGADHTCQSDPELEAYYAAWVAENSR